MLGVDGPGDKLFRIIRPRNEDDEEEEEVDGIMDFPSMGLPRLPSNGLLDASGPNQMLWNTDASLFGRFRNFPRDEGSQLDKVKSVALLLNCLS